MNLSKIDALDLRTDKGIERQRLDALGWWTDWDAVQWDFSSGRNTRKILVQMIVNTVEFERQMRRIQDTMRKTGAVIYGSRYSAKPRLKYRPPWKWHWWRIVVWVYLLAFWLGILGALAYWIVEWAWHSR